MLLLESCFVLLGAASILVAGQKRGFTNPVQPTVFEDGPTTRHTFNFGALSPSPEEPSSGESSSTSASSSSSASRNLRSDLFILTGENSATETSRHSSPDRSEGGSSVSSGTVGDVSTTASQTTMTTSSEDVAPALRPSSAVAMIGVMFVLLVW